MTTIAIISDDLTGAADTGIQFVYAGLKALVLLDARADVFPEADVVVGVTESRNDTPELARQKVTSWASMLARQEPGMVYKKIDSTLRGNLGAELDRCMSAFPGRLVVFAPAYPAAGRTTLDGRQYVHGVPLEQTEVAHDPTMPVHESWIPQLLAGQTDRRVGQVRLSEIAAGTETLAQVLREQVTAGAEILVCDACDDQDLARLVAGVRALDHPVIWTGSAGLARQLALTARSEAQAQATVPTPAQPMLVVAGSVSQTLRRQVSHYCDSMAAACIIADSDALAAGGPRAQAEVWRAAAEAGEILRAGRSAVVTTSLAPGSIANAGPAMVETARAISDRLGQVASQIHAGGWSGVMVLSGGDTAMGVCRSLGAVGIYLETEVLPGVVLGRLVGGPCEGLPVITKAGSFGEEDVLCQISRICQSHTLA